MCVFRLRQPPETLTELADNLKTLETLLDNTASTESQIHVIHDQFEILDKYEVSVEQEVNAVKDINVYY